MANNSETIEVLDGDERDLIRPQSASGGSRGDNAAGGAGLAMAADVLKAVADGARSLAEQLKDPATAPAADVLRKTGEGLDKASENLREQDVEELVARSRHYVKDNPAVTIGAAALAGFVLARMMRPGR
jgi:ElaB/YqjD/DUF883 family membrane-anchored ribosome-binding protein